MDVIFVVGAAGGADYQPGGGGHFWDGEERDRVIGAQDRSYGGTEFINGEADYQFHAFEHSGLVAVDAGGGGPELFGAFYVHGDIINKVPREQSGKNFRVAAVGVQLYRKIAGADLLYKGDKVRLQCGFAAADNYAGDPFFYGFEVSQEALVAYIFGVGEQRGGVAMGTEIITAGRESDGGYPAGIVDEIKTEHRAYFHDKLFKTQEAKSGFGKGMGHPFIIFLHQRKTRGPG